MESFLPFARPAGRPNRRSAPASLSARFALQTLEDRSLMSSSIQLSGLGFKPLGPGITENTTTAIPGLTVAGRVNSVAHAPVPFDPANPAFTGPTDVNDPAYSLFNTYFVGLPGGGVARTQDGGLTWKFVTDNMPTSSWGGADINRNLHVGAVAVSPLNRNLVFAGTGEVGGLPFGFAGSGLLRSTDGGDNWTLNKGPNNDFSGSAFAKFVFHPTDANVIYAVVDGSYTRYETTGRSAVYRTTNGGTSWQNINGNTGGSQFLSTTDFILDPTSPNVGYMGIESYGVVRTNNLQTGTGPAAVYTAPAAINYSLTLGGTGTLLAGGSFGQIRLAFGLGTPSQPSRIYAITTSAVSLRTTQLFRSDDSGINYRRLDPFPGLDNSTATNITPSIGTYNLEMIADPTNPSRVFFGGRGAGSIQVLTNADYNPLDTTQTPNFVNLTLPPNVGDAYTTVRNFVFDDTGVKDVNGRALTPGRLLLATDSGLYRFEAPNKGVTTITNFASNNLSFVSLNGAGTTALAAQQVFATGLPPRDDNRFILGTYINGTSIFQDTGPLAPTDANYQKLFNQQPAGGAGARGNGGETIFNPLDSQRVYRVANHSDRTEFGTFVYETTAGGLFQRSVDGGQTFTTSVNGILNPTRTPLVVALFIDPSPQVGTSDARLYLGTDAVNVSTDDGRNWSQLPDLPFVTNAPNPPTRRPKITAIATGRSGVFPIYAAMDFRTNGTVSDGPALYRLDGPTVPPFAWVNVTPGTQSYLLPPSNGAPGFPVLNDFSNDSDSLSGDISDIVVDPTNSDIVYITRDSTGIGTTGARRIYRSIDRGLNWTDIGVNLPASTATSDGLRIYSIALDSQRFNIDPNDPNNVVNQTDDDLYVGTSTGVYKLTNPVTSTTWTRVGGTGGGYDSTGTDLVAGAMPDVMVRDVKLNTTTGVLNASTFGRGIWQIQIRPYIRGLVYDDITGNGTFDAASKTVPTDKIFPGAVIVANDVTPNPDVQFANTTSATNGEWVFRSLPDSNYSFLPADASTQLVDTASRFYFTSSPIVRQLNELSTVNGQDLFLFRRVSINGVVYEDGNGNGTRDAGENPAVGFVVQLFAPAGTLAATKTLVAQVTSDADGNYSFLGVGPLRDVAVGPGTPFASGYQVVLSKQNFQTTETPGQTGILFSGTNLTDAANQGVTRIGAFRLGQIAGKVFEDTNGDGALNNAEVGLGGFVVSAVRIDDGTTAEVSTTTADGSYAFGDLVTTLKAGSYNIVVADKSGFVRTTPALAPQFVQSGTKTAGVNIGQFGLASIAGNVFEDVNGNGVRDAGEANPFVVTVSLIDPRTRTVVQSTQSDGAGNYAFGGLAPLDLAGNKAPYLVRFTDPLGVFAQTVADPAVTLTSRSANLVELPLFVRTSVTGFAFEDVNGNGTRDPGEPGLAGGSVSLLNSATAGVVQSTATDGNGNYNFVGVGPILGAVPFRVGANPSGFVQTTANPPDFVLTSNTPAAVPVDIGLFRLATFSGTVFGDGNGNGALDGGEAGIPGRLVQLLNADTLAVVASTTTDGAGNYSLNAGVGRFVVRVAAPAGFVQTTANPPAVATTSGLATAGLNVGLFQLTAVTGNVFDDSNGNGSREAEPGLAGVAVELVNTATNAVVATAATDATGFFSIPGVGPGNYAIRQVLRPGAVATTPVSQTFTATSGTPSTFNFGSFQPTTVSGNVYEDLNRSNTNNAGDIASPGWTVQLTRAGGILVGSVLSNAAGQFSFGNLPPGTYTARVLNRQGFSVLNNGTQTVTVTSGTPVTLAQVGVLKLGSLSGTVFLDSNRNGRLDSFERGLAGAVVQLLDANNAVASQATTDANGLYTFLGLQGGTFTVRLLSAAPGFAFSATGQTSLAATTAVGSTSANNAVTALNFGQVGRRRYALAADGGGGPRVQVYDALSNSILEDFFVYETTFTGGVRVAEADVNGDGIDDLIVAPGKGGGPRIRVLSGADGSELYNYFAYEPSFRDGLYVTAADVDGDGFADIITGTDSGGGPRVTVFGGKQGVVIADFFAYDSAFRGGVRIGAADTDGDGVAEIITAPGIGGGPSVKVFGGGNFRELGTFNAFEPSYTGGLYIANASADPATGRADIVVGSGIAYPSAPVVRVFDGSSFAAKAEIEAFPSGGAADGYRGEVRVASFDRNGDNFPDIAIASGAGSASRLLFVDGKNFRQIGQEIQPFESAFLGGIFIG